MRLNTYLSYDGNCEEAINFYKDILDAEITTFMRFADAPPTAMDVPEEYDERFEIGKVTFSLNTSGPGNLRGLLISPYPQDCLFEIRYKAN